MMLARRLLSIPRAVWFMVAAFVVAAGLLTGVILVIRSHNEALRHQSLSELVRSADEQISGGFYRAAMPYLERAMKSADTRDSWLAIAKRAYAIAAGTGDYRFLLRVATNGTASLPGSQELWAIKVLAQSRGGDPAGGAETARLHLTEPRYQSFGTEAVLRAHPDLNIEGAAISKQNRRLIDTLTSRSPTLFQDLANAIGSSDLLFDAALLYAWKGDLKEAYSVLVALDGKANPQAGMLVSYDAGHYDSVESYYAAIPEADRNTSLELLADDTLVLKNDYPKAATAYRAFVNSHPNAFWMPYVDLAWLAATQESSGVSTQEVHDLLQQATRIFPNQREVVLALASLDRGGGNLESAHALLAHFLKSNPWDLDANLMEMQISGASQSSAQMSSRLWELFYRADPTDKEHIGRYLAWYLLGSNDLQGLKLIFQQMEGRSGGEWVPFYRGIYYALRGDYSGSIDQFQKAETAGPRWQTLYNLAIVELKAGDAGSALNRLQKAESLVSGDHAAAAGAAERAAIHVALASALARTGDVEAAKREVLYAKQIDPNNLSAVLLLKKLDSAPQK